jgi:uncharacterized surface protein with fasciclin (FAS1) repeats
VVAGKIAFNELKDGQKLNTLDGREITVSVAEGQVKIDGAAIQQHDMKATNGVIHALDTVLKN